MLDQKLCAKREMEKEVARILSEVKPVINMNKTLNREFSSR